MLAGALVLVVGSLYPLVSGYPSFTIDYNRDCFLKDGQCFRYISGSIHYFRIPSAYWKDRLLKMYMTGLNAVQVYVPWNFHEPQPGVYNFRGDHDLEHFLNLTMELGLLVIMRPGPYICAEWDMGGLPAWLLHKKDIRLRASDPDYLNAVDSWLSVLLPKLRPRLYNNGGNIISVQVENEYGSFLACDYGYMRHLHTTFRLYLGDDVVLFTTDGSGDSYLKCGTLQDLYATVDFGPVGNATKAFEPMRRFQPRGPLVNSEYYTGWLDYWKEKHAVVSADRVSQGLEAILEIGANVNMYMFEGGTNFGFWSGADFSGVYKPITTSYDYDAPLTEAGDPTDKLLAIRSVIRKFQPVPEGPIPPPTQKYAYGLVALNKVGDLVDLLDILSPDNPIVTPYPVTFEDAKQYFGFMLYRTRLTGDVPDQTPVSSNVNGVHDRAYISVSGTFYGVLERDSLKNVNVTGKEGQWLDVLVENMGRINYGSDLKDFKGIIGNLTLGNDLLENWVVYPLNLDGPISQGWPHIMSDRVLKTSQTKNTTGPAIYSGTLSITDIGDTYLKLPKWSKGQVWINGFNLGRYWPVRGPQVTLYVPGTILSSSQVNNITVLELENAPDRPIAMFLDKPILNGTYVGK
ncbi:beta-galactosidase-1-like protein [Hyla sarda]|uniref:beta-galactosidase-1-like protein n=1 Tax=Hyla sarda TaxID=327740 RepID=UPI0024C42762|nr:beta-galactosidase-1-like protein [Hyla sarda]XP_056391359.1 beta-galactosidase-1-like protein [Hyla sarda]